MEDFTDFYEFYNFSYNLAESVKLKTTGFYSNQRAVYARKSIPKSELRKFIQIGILSRFVIKKLDTKSNILKLSVDNLVKNILVHSDITYEDYKKIPYISSQPDKVVKSKNGYDVILFKADNKYYELVIKTTKNKNENYVKSFHLLERKRYEKY